MSKRTVRNLSILVFVILFICTILSTIVYHMLLPKVTAYTPENGYINGKEYDRIVPISCIYTDSEGNYVFRLEYVEEKWKVERCSVFIEAWDGSYAAIRRAVSEDIEIALNPSRALKDEEIVKVVERK